MSFDFVVQNLEGSLLYVAFVDCMNFVPSMRSLNGFSTLSYKCLRRNYFFGCLDYHDFSHKKLKMDYLDIYQKCVLHNIHKIMLLFESLQQQFELVL